MRFLLTVLLIAIHSFVFPQKSYLYCGSLIDTRAGTVQKEMTIIIEKNKIIDVMKGYANAAATDKKIDLKAYTVMPGLMDCHVHLDGQTSPTEYTDRMTRNPADIAFLSALYAERTLLTGFTTVRDLGGTGVNIALRNAINKGTVKGPRVFTSGKSIATTGGHADPTNGYRK